MAHDRLPVQESTRLAPGEHDFIALASGLQIVHKLRPVRRRLRAGRPTPGQRSAKGEYEERLSPFHEGPFSNIPDQPAERTSTNSLIAPQSHSPATDSPPM